MPNALVTGTSSGLGLLAAEGLVERGWTVTGAMRNRSRATAETRWETLELDLTETSTIDATSAHIGERYGRLDALVSNAGSYFGGPWEEMTSEELRDVLEVNLVGTMALVRACLPWPAAGLHDGVVVVFQRLGQMAMRCGGLQRVEVRTRGREPRGARRGTGTPRRPGGAG